MDDSTGFSIVHIGKTGTEKKGIENLFKSIGTEGLSLSGGDPLLNETVLEAAINHSKGSKIITINPISFLTLELKKPGSQITEKDVFCLTEKVQKEGFSQRTKRVLSLLSAFEEIGLSTGDLQGPHPDIVQYALTFFNKFIKPVLLLQKRPFYNTYSYYIPINYYNLSDVIEISCVGKIRSDPQSLETYAPMMLQAREIMLKSKCRRDGSLLTYFLANKGTRLYYSMCCKPGYSPYIAFKSSMTLEAMAEMTSEAISQRMKEENAEFQKTALYNILNHPGFDGENNKPGSPIPFYLYVQSAEELLSQKTAKKVSVLNHTFTFDHAGRAKACEACFTISQLLYAANVSFDEWHDFLENKFPAEKYPRLDETLEKK